MIVQCPECDTRFNVDDALLLPDGRKVRCTQCKHVWFQEPPQEGEDGESEAQAAEKRAKQSLSKDGFDRGAFAVSLMKRGGETVHWGGKWSGYALPLYFHYRSCRNRANPSVSARFPYALAQLLRPYNFSGRQGEFEAAAKFDAKEVILKELGQVLERQGTNAEQPDGTVSSASLQKAAVPYLEELLCQTENGRTHALDDFEKLFLVAAFIDRDKREAANS